MKQRKNNRLNAAVAGDRNNYVTAIAVFVGLLVLHIALGAVYRFLEEFTRSTMENKFKEKLFRGLLTKSYVSVVRVHSGEWINRPTFDTVVTVDG
ncbi:MAG: hypothetical protein Q4C91_23250 [Eubacteriales bacterium]|nr:hypothetical protein [Eubacteriales bacterium]